MQQSNKFVFYAERYRKATLEEEMDKTTVERLAECAAMIEELSQRISRIRAGEVHHQAKFKGGSWEDITADMLGLYERLLKTNKYLAEHLRNSILRGEA